MKKIVYVSVLVLSTISSSYAQKISADKVPAVVSDAFKAKFPTASDIKWEMEDKAEYEVDFRLNNEKLSANFDTNGKWLETEKKINVSQLPKVVSQTLAKEFAGYSLDEAEKIETADNGINYEVKVKKGEDIYEVNLSSKGEVLKKKVDKDEKD